ncbi:MAG TPA: hypothetical protein VFQ35_28415 [Polyangiaceae bacterium]|nr:hypothetical protein [Polyangiaceae bacterium]
MRTGLVSILVAAISSMPGCVSVHESAPVTSERLLRTSQAERRVTGEEYPTRLLGGSGLSADGRKLALELLIQHTPRCEVVRTKTWETTTTTERTSRAGVALTAGALLSSLFVVGVIGAAQGESLSKKSDSGRTELTSTGVEVYTGVWGVPLLIDGVIASIGSIDSVDSRTEDRVERHVRPCAGDAAPGADLSVTLTADGKPISGRRTGPDGKVKFEVAREELASPPKELKVFVGELPTLPSADLVALLEHVTENWSTGELPPVPSVTPTPAAPPVGPSLFGVALSTATRELFESAVISHGCSRTKVENRNVSRYTLECLALPGFREMKVLYDGSDHVVRVKYSGALDSSQCATMRRLLTEEYGSPRSETGRQSDWRLPAEFSLTLDCRKSPAELLYNNIALDTELSHAAEQQQEQRERERLDELKKQRGKAF